MRCFGRRGEGNPILHRKVRIDSQEAEADKNNTVSSKMNTNLQGVTMTIPTIAETGREKDHTCTKDQGRIKQKTTLISKLGSALSSKRLLFLYLGTVQKRRDLQLCTWRKITKRFT